MKEITVHLRDAMDARILIEKAGVLVIFSKSTKDRVTFQFRCSVKRLERIMRTFKANGIAPILDPPYVRKTIKLKSRKFYNS